MNEHYNKQGIATGQALESLHHRGVEPTPENIAKAIFGDTGQQAQGSVRISRSALHGTEVQQQPGGVDVSAQRKNQPVFSGVLAYFPDAMFAIAELSKAGNDKHNPGQPLHWSKDKSNDHADCLARHLLEHGTIDPEDGISHTVKVAWRALALLQIEIEENQNGK